MDSRNSDSESINLDTLSENTTTTSATSFQARQGLSKDAFREHMNTIKLNASYLHLVLECLQEIVNEDESQALHLLEQLVLSIQSSVPFNTYTIKFARPIFGKKRSPNKS